MASKRELVFQKVQDNLYMCLDDNALKGLPGTFVAHYNPKGMTDKERGALHVWLRQVAIVLNDNNLYHEYKHPIRGITIEKMWDMKMVKDLIFKPTLANLIGKQSTEDQETVEASQIAEAISRAYAMHMGIVLPDWPSLR